MKPAIVFWGGGGKASILGFIFSILNFHSWILVPQWLVNEKKCYVGLGVS